MDVTPEYLEQLERQIIELNEKLTAAESLKSHFISNITNEIVNPFASILGLSTQILETTEISFEQMKYLASLIHTETFHLDFQLRNIFAAAKIEAGQTVPEIRFVNLHEMISDLIELFELEAGKKNVAINLKYGDSIGLDFCWPTDVVKLKLILINFLHNAVKFTDHDTEISIYLSTEGDNLRIVVEDQGIGITKECQDDIFDRFTTVKAGINTAYRGNGLGLSINKALTDILDGRIEVESESGTGAKFTLLLPPLHDEAVEMGSGTDFLFDDELIF